MQTENEKKCFEIIEPALKENNCEIVPKMKLKNSPITKFIDIALFKAFAELVEISFDIVEKKA